MITRFSAGNYRRAVLAALVFCLAALSPAAQELPQPEKRGFFSGLSWFVEGTILFFPEDNGMESGPMPVLPSPGAGASLPVGNLFRLEAVLGFYYTFYGYSDVLARAVPLELEHRSAQVFGSLLSIQGMKAFDVAPALSVRAYGGFTADMRIVLVAPNLWASEMDDARRQTDLARSYFWSQGRWLFPVVGAGLDYTLNSGFKLGIDFRVWMPMYRLWTGENLPGIEGWRFGPGIRLTLR